MSPPDQTHWPWPFICTNCRKPYPDAGLPYRCPHCGGVFDFAEDLHLEATQFVARPAEGICRFKSSFPIPPSAELISLGEGNTPLVHERFNDRDLYFKLEGCNPTGSFKDRGSAVLVSSLAAAGVKIAIEDSSGNAGASFAAYAARAGIQARIFVPDYASGPKRAQMEAYGAEVVRILGPRSAVTEAALRAVEEGVVYASHANLPHGLAGMATLAYELYEAFDDLPEAIVVPVGQGTLLLGLSRGFRALREASMIERLPKLVGVQAMACAPLWAVFASGAVGLGWVSEGVTQAEGIRILHPLRGDAVLQAIEESGGWVEAVEEEAISAARNALGARGLYVEPTSAVVWAALEPVLSNTSGSIAFVLTGSGLKSP